MIDLPNGLHGAFRRADLIRQLGFAQVRMLLRDGKLVRYSRHVLVDRRLVLELPTRAAAALLHVGRGSVLTRDTAARLYGCSAADDAVVHVLSRYFRKIPRRPGLAVHQGSIDEADVLELDGLRTLGLELVIADMLCVAPRPVALACADQALAALDPRFRNRFRADVAERISDRADPRGTRRAGILLELATGLPESPAESRLLLMLFDAGFPLPELQYSVRDIAGRERYRLDFAWEQPRIALEYDGYEAHEDRAERDAARDSDLRSRGWTVIRANASDLRNPRQLKLMLGAALLGQRHVA